MAVVGSFGKTTATRAVMAALGRSYAQHTSWNARGFLPLRLLLTPPLALHRVFEVGIRRPGTMVRYARFLRPDVVVVTSIGSEHARSLGPPEEIRDEKAHMVRALSPDGLAVLNGDDPNVRWMSTQTEARVVTYGFGAENDVRASGVRLGAVPRDPGLRGMRDLLTMGFVCAPATLFDAVRQLPPGCHLTYRGGATRVASYWDALFPRKGEEDRSRTLEAWGRGTAREAG